MCVCVCLCACLFVKDDMKVDFFSHDDNTFSQCIVNKQYNSSNSDFIRRHASEISNSSLSNVTQIYSMQSLLKNCTAFLREISTTPQSRFPPSLFPGVGPRGGPPGERTPEGEARAKRTLIGEQSHNGRMPTNGLHPPIEIVCHQHTRDRLL